MEGPENRGLSKERGAEPGKQLRGQQVTHLVAPNEADSCVDNRSRALRCRTRQKVAWGEEDEGPPYGSLPIEPLNRRLEHAKDEGRKDGRDLPLFFFITRLCQSTLDARVIKKKRRRSLPPFPLSSSLAFKR